MENYKPIISSKMKENYSFGLPVKFRENHQIVSFYPVTDNILNKVKAWIVSYVNTNEIKSIQFKSNLIKILIYLLITTTILFIYFLVNQKNLLSKLVEEKTKSLKDLNEELEDKIETRTTQLTSTNKQLLNIIKSADLGYWNWNLKTNHLEVNDRWLSMIGMKRENFNFTIQEWQDRIDPKDFERISPIIAEAIKNNKSFIVEFRMKHHNGKYVWIESSGSAITFDHNNEPLIVYGIHRDIQDKKVKEKLLQEQENIIQNQVKIDAISGMLTNIAHQWRQPLSIISTNVSGLQLFIDLEREITNEDITKCANLVLQNTEYLSKTINDFTTLFNNENNANTRKNIREILNNLKDIIKGNLTSESIKLIINIEHMSIINVNSSLFIQALLNIIKNSTDAFNQNDISKEARYIFIEVLKENNETMIKIKDNAGGIDKNIIDSIFEPYFTTKHQSIGKGLGLYMTYQVITHQFKGTISAKNITYQYNGVTYKGVVFEIMLP